RALLPFVNRLRFLKAKPALQVTNSHTTILAQTGNVLPGCGKINDWECLSHCRSSISVGDTTEYRIFQNNASSNLRTGRQLWINRVLTISFQKKRRESAIKPSGKHGVRSALLPGNRSIAKHTIEEKRRIGERMPLIHKCDKERPANKSQVEISENL